MKRHSEYIFRKMHTFVGAPFESINLNCSKLDWFLKYTWSKKEQETFRDWLVDYLMKYPEAYRELSIYRRRDKKIAQQIANSFIFSYGWKLR